MSSKYSFLLPGALGVLCLLLIVAVVILEVHWWTIHPAIDGIPIAVFIAIISTVVFFAALSGKFFLWAYEEMKKRRN